MLRGGKPHRAFHQGSHQQATEGIGRIRGNGCAESRERGGRLVEIVCIPAGADALDVREGDRPLHTLPFRFVESFGKTEGTVEVVPG